MNENKITETSKAKAQFIDIKKIVRSQNNIIVRNLPNCLINYIKKSFHQDEINEILRNNQFNYGVDFVKGCVSHLNLTIKSYNEHLLPTKGKFIFAGNHPLGGVDFAVVLQKISERFSNIKIIANEMFLQVENTKELFLPVSIVKNNKKEKTDAIENHLSDNEGQMLIFPAGKVARKVKGKLDDGFWHRSFIRNAVEHKRDIIPFFIGGQNSKKFYRLAKFRKMLKIKANLELFLLPGEVFKQKNALIPIIYGSPIPYSTFNDSKTHLEWAQEIKKVVYELGNEFKHFLK